MIPFVSAHCLWAKAWCTRNTVFYESLFIPNLLCFPSTQRMVSQLKVHRTESVSMHLSAVAIPGQWHNFKPPTRICFKFNHFRSYKCIIWTITKKFENFQHQKDCLHQWNWLIFVIMASNCATGSKKDSSMSFLTA